MNRQTAEKLRFFMGGMEGRIGSGDIFKVEAIFRSGLKNYSLTAPVKPDEKIRFNFSGNTFALTFPEFTDFICGIVPDYDELLLVFSDEIKDNQFYCRDKDVTFRTAEPSVSGDGKTGSSGKGSINADQLHEVENAVTRASMSNRAYYIKPENPRAAEMLKAIGVMGPNGKIKNDKIRKFNQIDHFIELIDPMLRKICEARAASGKDKTVNIVDCACGKSYLSFALCYYIRFVLKSQCYFTGLDYNATVIEDSKQIANAVGYTNMKFVETDIGKYEPDREYDLLISLHACDTATDLALRFGIDHDVKAMVCVPCCHKEMNSQNYSIDGLEPVLKYGILKARIADSLTDGLRGLYLEGLGYDVSMVEYISPLDTPKNLMMRIVKTREPDIKAIENFGRICDNLGVRLSIAGKR